MPDSGRARVRRSCCAGRETGGEGEIRGCGRRQPGLPGPGFPGLLGSALNALSSRVGGRELADHPGPGPAEAGPHGPAAGADNRDATVAFGILPVFAIANAGISFGTVTADAIFHMESRSSAGLASR